MEENKIYIKLEIEKNEDTGELAVLTRFNPDAPNFTQDKEGVYWVPTNAEKDFLNEAFDMLLRKKH